MSATARYIVDAVVLEHRSPSELARSHKVARSWIYKLLKRFQKGGYAALEARSRRPRSCPHQVDPKVQKLIVKLRCELAAAGHDAGPQTIHYHLTQRASDPPPSVATIWRILKRKGLITPQPHKRPRASFIRFEAKLPNETWQVDATPWRLADGTPVEILNWLDDRSRVALASSSFRSVKARDVARSFRSASKRFGLPASVLSDNAAVFRGRQGGKVILELTLERLAIVFKHSTPNHPQTCGKVERFHQTLKRFLGKQTPAESLAELQFQLDAFREYYNHVRPHRALNRQTPMSVFKALIKAKPTASPAAVDHRVRRDKIDAFGKVTLRYLGKLRHIPVGLAHKNRKVRLLVAGADVRVITEDGELIRALTLDPERDYQPLGGHWPVHNDRQQVSTMS